MEEPRSSEFLFSHSEIAFLFGERADDFLVPLIAPLDLGRRLIGFGGDLGPYWVLSGRRDVFLFPTTGQWCGWCHQLSKMADLRGQKIKGERGTCVGPAGQLFSLSCLLTSTCYWLLRRVSAPYEWKDLFRPFTEKKINEQKNTRKYARAAKTFSVVAAEESDWSKDVRGTWLQVETQIPSRDWWRPQRYNLESIGSK